MNWRRTLFLGLGVFLTQLFLSELMTIRGIRPDFLLIFVMYMAMQKGSPTGVVTGFVIGFLEDLLSAGSLFGLASLTKSLSGFLLGRLHGRYPRMSPVVFHVAWVSIVLIHFFLYIYVRFQSVYNSSKFEFWVTWLFTVIYTLVFVGIVQVIVPLHRIQPEE
ncbi:MAG: rod shape-determining protein MreD [Candidatus Neomarinimicrobiota bacterium]